MATSSSQTTDSQRNLSELEIDQYEIQNFMKISQRDEFLNFDVEKLQCLLESDNLNITCEEDAYDAIFRWYHHDVSARRQHLPRLVACLRLTQFDVDFLLTHIQSLPGCELLASMTSTWIRDPTARSNINIRFTEPRVGLGAGNCDGKTLLAVLCMNKDKCVLQYNKAEDKWQKYASINIEFMSPKPLLKDDNLLFIGGGGRTPSKKFLSWNIPNKTWQELPLMKQARAEHCVVELDGKIYAIGGYGENYISLQSVERYTESNGWESVAPLLTARSEAGAVTFNGKIYIMGGCDRSYLKSVECYNPDSNNWSKCADMAYNHSSNAVAAHNGHIYVVDNIKDRPAVERYDPQRDTWSQICCLESGYLVGCWGRRACASFDNKLWAIGHHIETRRTEVTVYNEANDRWVQKNPLPDGWIYSCFVAPLSLLTSK